MRKGFLPEHIDHIFFFVSVESDLPFSPEGIPIFPPRFNSQLFPCWIKLVAPLPFSDQPKRKKKFSFLSRQIWWWGQENPGISVSANYNFYPAGLLLRWMGREKVFSPTFFPPRILFPGIFLGKSATFGFPHSKKCLVKHETFGYFTKKWKHSRDESNLRKENVWQEKNGKYNFPQINYRRATSAWFGIFFLHDWLALFLQASSNRYHHAH